MTDPITKAERDELLWLHAAATPTPWAKRGDTWIKGDPRGLSDVICPANVACGDYCQGGSSRIELEEKDRTLIIAARNALPRLLAALEAAEADARDLRDVLLRNNFSPCDIPACNCNGWHERSDGNGFYARFREIDDAVGDHNGKTLLQAVQEIVAERDSLKARLHSQPCKGCPGCPSDCPDDIDRLTTERDSLKAKLAEAEKERDEAIADRIFSDSEAWVALGRPDGTHDMTTVHRLCLAHADAKAKLAALVDDVDVALMDVSHSKTCPGFKSDSAKSGACVCGIGRIIALILAADPRNAALKAAGGGS